MERLPVKAIPSSFVSRSNKIMKDKGAGEAKLFVGPTKKSPDFDAFFAFDSDYTYSFDKENLLEYLKQTKIEYVYQAINQYKDLNLKTWNELRAEVENMQEEDLKCKIFKYEDESRYYVRSDEDVFKKTFRRIALPKITDLVFEKDENKNIWLRLYVNYEYNHVKELIIENTDNRNNYTIDELGIKLKEMYDNPRKTGHKAAIHMFGFQYGECIDNNQYPISEIIKRAGLNDSYKTEVSVGINIYRSVRDIEYGIKFYNDDDYSYGYQPNTTEVDTDKTLESIAKGGFNRIIYGAPGCGKSHYISEKLINDKVQEENIVRVTFHPEYSNVDFIGQILPSVDKEVVKYVFNPGPFSIALTKAYNTTKMVYLIIEEINRGNAAAIFGDMFQLLDRASDSNKANYSASEYPINNPNMQKYLIENTISSEIKQRLEKGVYIPSNLTIYATMNSSDQNVFTLDTAFKRRWSFEQISNDIVRDTKHGYKGWFVPGTNVTWEVFLTKINNQILEYRLHNQTNEDKRLGKYFVSKKCLTEHSESFGIVQESANEFAYKVLEYIWNDVCKIGREEWFDTEKYKTLEDLIAAYMSPKGEDNPLSIFRNITFD